MPKCCCKREEDQFYEAKFEDGNPAPKGALSCKASCSRKWMYFMNSIVFLGGWTLLAISIFNAVAQGDVLAAIGQAGVVGSIVAGVILVFTSLLGCLATAYRKRWALIIYLLFATAFSVAFLAVGVLLTFTVKNLDTIDGVNSATLSERVESQLNDLLIAVFNQCCTDQFDGIDRLLGCSDPDADLTACFTFEETYQDALERVRNSGLCNFLENTEIDGQVVVGDPAVNGGCANGDGVAFKAVFTAVVEEALVPIGGAFIALGVLLVITLITTCIVIFTNKNVYEDEDQVAMAKEGTLSPALPPPGAYKQQSSGYLYQQPQF